MREVDNEGDKQWVGNNMREGVRERNGVRD